MILPRYFLGKKEIKSLKRLESIVSYLRAKKKKIAFTNGCFDIIHLGHIKYLASAKSLADILIVGANSDDSVRCLKGKSRPINSQKARVTALSALEPVDYAIIFNEPTPLKLIKKIKPDFLVKGGDWKLNQIVGRDFVKSYGGKVIRIPFMKGYSTTKLIEKLKNRQFYRILDVNINRAKEALRICEEITRFILKNRALTKQLRAIRHKISQIISELSIDENLLLKSRNVKNDFGKEGKFEIYKRKNLYSILIANFQRAKESIRTLEEFSKLVSDRKGAEFKNLRFKLYSLEKKLIGKAKDLYNH